MNKFDWDDSPGIWIRLPDHGVVIASVYRQFTSKLTKDKGLAFEKRQLEMLTMQLEMAEERGRVIICGDVNFNLGKNTVNSRSKLFQEWKSALLDADMVWLPTGHTWTSFGTFEGKRKTSTLDHVYVPRELASEATVRVLDNAMSDHNPVEAVIPLEMKNNADTETKLVKSRNWKNADWGAICADLDNIGAGKLTAPLDGGGGRVTWTLS